MNGEMHHVSVTIKLISGEILELEKTSTIGQLKQALLAQRPSVGACKLFLNGVPLSSRQTLSSISLPPGAFLVAVPGRQTTKTAAVAPAVAATAEATPPTEAAPQQTDDQAIDTLLPGYALRPQPSPAKARRRARGGVFQAEAEGDALFQDLVREQEAAAAAAVDAPDDRGEEERDQGRGRRRKRPAPAQPPNNTEHYPPSPSLTLPPCLAALEFKFRRFVVLHDFLMRARVTPTVPALLGGLTGADGHAVTLDDVRCMARLVPRVVHIAEDEGGRDAATADPEEEDDAAAMTVSVVDPWDASGRPQVPEWFLSETVGMQAPPAPPPARTPSSRAAPKPRTNAQRRKAWEFRKAAVAAVAVLHDAHCAAADTTLSDSGQWHPAFPLDAITLEEALQAAESARAVPPAPPSAAAPPQLIKRHPPCTSTHPLTAFEFVDHLLERPSYVDQAVHIRPLPPRPAVLAPPPSPPLPPPVVAALHSRGIDSLYSHQGEALQALRAGRPTVVATSTASGKSVCYLAPILEALAVRPGACAILIYPTKALAQDQLRALREMMDAAGLVGGGSSGAVAVYDGDTPMSERPVIQDRVRVMLTNPDMLHASILPKHREFARILANLAFLVIDEGHIYKGAFGCHVSLVLRRLRRLCHDVYKAPPTCCITTATLANPREHAATLVGVDPGDVVVVDGDGSPTAAKRFVLWNPPLAASSQQKKAKPPKKKKARAEGEGNGPAPDPAVSEPTPPPLTARQRKLAKEAAAALSAVGGTAATATALAPRGQHPTIVIGSRGAAPPAPDNPSLPASHEWRRSVVDTTSAAADALGSATTAPASEQRSSSIVEIAALVAEAVQHNLRVIAFCGTRKLAELVSAYAREALAASMSASSTPTDATELTDRIATYRGGYSPQERRALEAALFSGRLLGVAATNALELGIDVGGLDLTLHLGFPGSVASLWQQAGRAGRRSAPSASIYVAWGSSPTDQYFLRDPEALFSRPIEAAAVDPTNPIALGAHLTCAAAESPLRLAQDAVWFGGAATVQAAVSAAIDSGVLGRHPTVPGAICYVGPLANPSSATSLRAIDQNRFSIVDSSAGQGAVIEEIEESKAFFVIYDGCVYLHGGKTYLCSSLDLGARVALVRPADVKYYTTTVDFTTVQTIGSGESAFGRQHNGTAPFHASRAVVTTRWLGFVRIWRGSGKVFDAVDLFLPDVSFETDAAYMRLPPSARLRVQHAGLDFRASVHAAVHALLAALPLFVVANAGDCEGECDSPWDTRYKPERLLLYDAHPGGLGLSAAAIAQWPALLRRARDIVAGCACTDVRGCPNCVQHGGCREYNIVLCKMGGLIVLESALEIVSSSSE